MFGEILKQLRKENNLVLREASALTGIDQGVLSKYESEKRKPTEAHLELLALAYQADYAELRKEWLIYQVTQLIQYEPLAPQILLACESRIEYLSSDKSLEVPPMSSALRTQLERIDDLHETWKEKRPINKLQVKRMRDYFNVAYTYESNRIEGNTLSLHETNLVVAEGVTIGGKSVEEHLEAINHHEAIDFVTDLGKEGSVLDKRSVMDVHRLILKGIDDANAGRLRKVPVRISGSDHEPPQPFLLEKHMEDYFRFYAVSHKSLHPVLLAAEMHERLVTIHPFIDGNGRTSRLVMNLILLQNGYTIANLKGDHASRMEYYNALQDVQLRDTSEAFHLLVAGAVEESLKAHLALT